MKLNSPAGRVLYILVALFAVGLNVFLWTQFEGGLPIVLILFSLVTVVSLTIHGRHAFLRRDS